MFAVAQDSHRVAIGKDLREPMRNIEHGDPMALQIVDDPKENLRVPKSRSPLASIRLSIEGCAFGPFAATVWLILECEFQER